MSRRAFAAATAVLLVFSIAGTAWALTTEPHRSGPATFEEPVSEPIDQSQPHLAVGFTPADFQFGVDVETHGIYVGYGGALKVKLNNSRSDREMFVVYERVVWLGGIVEKELSVPVGARSVGDLGVVWLPGPNFASDQDYKVSLSILIMQGSTWRQLGAAGDIWIDFQSGTLPVSSAGEASEYTRATNEYAYYDKANALVKEKAPTVDAAVGEATPGMPGNLTYEKLCGVFDWVSSNITYVAEPEGADRWQAPEETLRLRGGDCEDFTLLISDMVLEMGGTPRMYLIDEHAFAAIWVGASKGAAEAAISNYYNAELRISFIDDAGGFWVVADPLGSLYLGGLAVSSKPVNSTDWDFTETTLLYGIDMTRAPGRVQPWEQDRVWGIFQIACDILFLVAVVLLVDDTPKPRCARCGRKFSGDIVACPTCCSPHHPFCAGNGPCANCGGLLVHPAIPPPLVPPLAPQTQAPPPIPPAR
jgi:hypothetical protein